MLCNEVRAVAIQHHKKGKSITGFGPILHHQIFVVLIIYINQYNYVISSQLLADRFITLEKLVQSQAPLAPVSAKLQEDTLVLSLGDNYCISNLSVTICRLIVDIRPMRFGSVVWRLFGATDNGRGQECRHKEQYAIFHKRVMLPNDPKLSHADG